MPQAEETAPAKALRWKHSRTPLSPQPSPTSFGGSRVSSGTEACGLPAVPWLPRPHDTEESVFSSQQMMLSNPYLPLGPSNLSESHPCCPWEGSSALGFRKPTCLVTDTGLP